VNAARALATFALASGLLGANVPHFTPAPLPAASASPAMKAATAARAAKAAAVLERYLTALERLPAPQYLSFEYSVEQGGATNISQVHRVYRAGSDVRDEVIAEDGHRLRRPHVRIRHDGADRYALAALAPTPARYTFTFSGSPKSAVWSSYTFRTAAKSAAPFTVTEVTLDGTSFLPIALRFRSTAGKTHGHGMLLYAKADRYWLIREARVDALLDDAPAGERIVWSAYRFPASLPSATFADQVEGPSILPKPAATP
jgi:hypothetical protein